MAAPPAEPASPSHTPPPPARASIYLALAGGIVCIGFSAIFVRFANTTGDVVGFFRLGIAALALSIPAALNWQRGRARIPRRAIWLGLLGGLAFAIDIALWNTAVTKTSASIATLMGNTAPVWVSLGAWLIFREKLRQTYWLGLAVAMGGAGLIMGLDALQGLETNLGNLLALLAGMAYAAYQLITKRARDQIDNLSYMWLFTTSGGLLLLIVSLALGHPLTDLPAKSYLALLALGLFSHMGGWLLINYAVGRLDAALVSVTLLGQPIVTALVALPILGEMPRTWHILGGLVTLIGIYIVHRSAANSRR